VGVAAEALGTAGWAVTPCGASRTLMSLGVMGFILGLMPEDVPDARPEDPLGSAKDLLSCAKRTGRATHACATVLFNYARNPVPAIGKIEVIIHRQREPRILIFVVTPCLWPLEC
jgi:hypothetical protein